MDVELNLETKTHIYFTKTNKITKPCRFGGEASDPVHVQTNIIQFRIFISFLGTGLVTSSLRTTLYHHFHPACLERGQRPRMYKRKLSNLNLLYVLSKKVKIMGTGLVTPWNIFPFTFKTAFTLVISRLWSLINEMPTGRYLLSQFFFLLDIPSFLT